MVDGVGVGSRPIGRLRASLASTSKEERATMLRIEREAMR